MHRRVWRETLGKLQDTLWAEVLMRHSFAAPGAAQFARDVRALTKLADAHVPGAVGVGSSALAALLDAVRVLSLPLEAGPNEEEAKAETGKTTMTLQQASDRFFVDNAEAKRALDDLDAHNLTPAHARSIVQRRVEYQG